ncbi:hypothetical protein BSZ39_06235 [Bowdeniella nasicola]|uniref:Murein biosynthesis integral membrane protein MurJ n=1 Tax=Bowdeniella nasicola TaxID=208480 RepID=A0A1Q5Q2H8_9ACTO|nr:murein biosynthesis integral membrane protein MurJ [Bowdeniella nasicola]OKL54053.1 hypothetical protein BSZ39_06235 [Bowdeniella nasicola]
MVRERGLAGSSALMFSGTLVSRILGLLRNALLVAAIGASAGQADPFAVANTLPNIIYNLLAGGVLNAVLVPQVVRALRRKDGDEYVNRLLTVAGLGLFGLTVVATLASSLIVTLYASQLDPAWFDLAVAFAVWCLPQIFFYGVYTLLGQVLNAKGSFGPYMWAPVANNVVAIIGLVIYLWVFGFARDGSGASPGDWTGARIALLAGFATLGVAIQAGVLITALRKTGFRFKWRLGVAGLGGASRMAMWSFAGLAVGQLGFLAVTNVAAAANGAAATSDIMLPANQTYNNAFLIYMLPQSLFTTSLITALFPRMSDKAAAGNHAGVAADFGFALRITATFTLFAAVAFAVLAVPLAHVVLPSVTADEARNVALVLLPLALGIPFQGAWSVVQRAFFAYEDARTQFFIQIPMALAQIIISLIGWWLAPPLYWVPIAAASTAVSMAIGAVVGYVKLSKKLPNVDHGRILGVVLRLAIAAGIAGLVALGGLNLIGLPEASGAASTFTRSVFTVALLGTIMAATYIGVAKHFRIPDIDQLLAQVLRLTMKIVRKVPIIGPRLAGASRAQANVVDNSWSRDERREEDGQSVDDLSGLIGHLVGGRYRLDQLSTIPASGAGTWLHATDTVLDHAVALFLSRDDLSADQLVDSARRAYLIDSDHFPAIRDVEVDPELSRAYVVTDTFPEPNLADVHLSPDEASAIVGTAASILEGARSRGVHHLNITPDHIRIAPTGDLVIVGLGIDGALREFDDGGDAVERSLLATEADADDLQELYSHLCGAAGSQSLAEARSAADVVTALSPITRFAYDSALDTLAISRHSGRPAWLPVETETTPAPAVSEPPPPPGPAGDWHPSFVESSLADPGPDFTEIINLDLDDVTPAAPSHAAPRRSGDTVEEEPADEPEVEPETPAEPDVPVPAPMPLPPPVTSARAATDESTTTPQDRRRRASEALGKTKNAILSGASADVATAKALEAAEKARIAADKARQASRRQADVTTMRIEGLVTKLDGFAAKHSINLPGEVEEYDSSTPLSRRKIDPSPLILTVFAALLIIVLFLALSNLRQPGTVTPPTPEVTRRQATEEPSKAPAEPTEEATPEPTTEALAAPVISSIDVLDPQGDGKENPDLTPRAFDGDPESFWRSRFYKNPTYGNKAGIGLKINLTEKAKLSGVTLTLRGNGGHVQVKTDANDPIGGSVVSEADMSPTTELSFDTIETDTVILWFTALPKADSDGKNRVELAEITLK